MQQLQILVVCFHPEILATILRLINSNQAWNAVGSETAEEALELFSENDIDLVLLGSGISRQVEDIIKMRMSEINPKTRIIHHFGGGGGLLLNELQAAISNNCNGNFNIDGHSF